VQANTQYVDGAYLGGGNNGSSAQPWTRIQDGIAAAAPGAIVAIAASSYAEHPLVQDKAVRLWGRCPSLVAVVGYDPSYPIVTLRNAGGTEIHDLSVSGGVDGVSILNTTGAVLDRIWCHDTSATCLGAQDKEGPTSLAVRRSLVEGSHAAGILVYGGALTVESSEVRDIAPDAQGTYGWGIAAWPSPTSGARSQLVVSGSVVERVHEAGIFVLDADATIDSCAVRDTTFDGDHATANGLLVGRGPSESESASAVVSGSVFERTAGANVAIDGAEAELSATTVRESLVDHSGGYAGGIYVAYAAPDTGQKARLVLRQSLVTRSLGKGIWLDGAEALVESSIVRDTQAGAQPGFDGVGVVVSLAGVGGHQGSLELRGALVESTVGAGVGVLGSKAIVEDCLVRDVLPGSAGLAWGLQAQGDTTTHGAAEVEVRRTLIQGIAGVGIGLAGASATIDSSVVRDSSSAPSGLYGHGIHVQAIPPAGQRGSLTLTSVLVESSVAFGVAGVDSDLMVDGCIVRDTTASPGATYGDGVVAFRAFQPTSLTLRDTLVENSVRAAVSSFGAPISIQGSALLCQAFAMDGEAYAGQAYSFDDAGGNECGCGADRETCLVVSSGLTPPTVGE